MARHLFPGDTVFERDGDDVEVGDGQACTFWSEPSGGTEYTDLQTALGATLTPPLVADSVGNVGPVRGPDGVVLMWRDVGNPIRYPVVAVDELGYVLERFRNVESGAGPGGGGTGVSDHGGLSGLSDDDHTQYLNAVRGDGRYYTRAQVDALLTSQAATVSAADRNRANHSGVQDASSIFGTFTVAQLPAGTRLTVLWDDAAGVWRLNGAQLSGRPGNRADVLLDLIGGEEADVPAWANQFGDTHIVGGSVDVTPPVTPPPPAGKPGAANTGYRNALTVRAGDYYVTTAGAVIQNLDITGKLTIAADNVTVRDCFARGGILISRDNALVEYCTTKKVDMSSCMSPTVRFCEITGTDADCMHVTSDNGRYILNAVLTNNWLHNFQPAAGSHSDGIQVRGVNGLLFKSNFVDFGAPNTDNWNACVFLESANGGNQNCVIEGNWLDGSAFTFMLGVAAGQNKIINNRVGGVRNWDQPGNPSYFYGNGTRQHYQTVSGNVNDATDAPINLGIPA